MKAIQKLTEAGPTILLFLRSKVKVVEANRGTSLLFRFERLHRAGYQDVVETADGETDYSHQSASHVLATHLGVLRDHRGYQSQNLESGAVEMQAEQYRPQRIGLVGLCSSPSYASTCEKIQNISRLQTVLSAVSSTDSEIRGRCDCHHQGCETVDQAKDGTLVHEPVI